MPLENRPIKFVLISPYEEIHSCGVRSLSSYLKKRGVKVNVIFYPIESRLGRYLSYRAGAVLPSRIVDDIANIASDATCIGISLMTDYFDTVVDLTRELKKRLPYVSILWGGIHPTIFPEQCVDYADFVCVGEGYEAAFELCRHLNMGDKFPKIPGIYYKQGNELIVNVPSAPILNIDLLPFMDYGIEGHYIRNGNSIVPMTSNLLKRSLGFWYTSFFTYGCPFSCSYCCNSTLHKLNSGYKIIRKHSPEYIVEEIKYVRRLHPFIKMVKFNDDSFMSLSEEEMEKFAKLQIQFGKTPFVVTGMSPGLVTEQKIGILVKAGLRRIRIGIQTGSERILREVYNRRTTNEDIIRSSEILSRFSRKLVSPAYDVILDNPWEKPEDLAHTFNLLSKLKRPFVLNIYSLKFYPHTEIYEKALSSGIINAAKDSAGYSKSYLNWEPNYLNCLIALKGLIFIPSFISRYLLSKRIVNKNPVLPKIFRNILNALTIAKKAYHMVLKRDVTMLPYSLARFLK